MGSIHTTNDGQKVWATLITKMDYLEGLLVLDYSLKRAKSRYPLVALYTDSFPCSGREALAARGIPQQRVDHLLPSRQQDYAAEPRFLDTWTKLAAFGLVQYERLVLLDSDMLVLQNMDELMDVDLDAGEMGGAGLRVFAASHACVCNPLQKLHYPKNWVPENCPFTRQHSQPDQAQVEGAPCTAGLSMPNSGLLVINPSKGVYSRILTALDDDEKTMTYDFPDQSLLGGVFAGRWASLPYVYNALKTLRWPNVHDAIWRDGEVKNVHYILGQKPWQVDPGEVEEETVKWWWDANRERKRVERSKGLEDGL